MSYIGRNIKKIRTVKKLSQAAFADMFNLARPSVGAYEEGRSEPKIDTIIAIAAQFGLSTDALLRKELTVNELYSLDILKGEFDPTKMPPALGKSSLADEKNNNVSYPSSPGIPLVTKLQVFEYIVNIGNKDFIRNLKTISLPAEGKATFMAFEHHSDEMYHQDGGLREGDILLCQKLDFHAIKKVKTESVFVVVMPTGIFARRISRVGDKNIQFRVDNPAYEDLNVPKSGLLEVWEVKGVWTTFVSEPSLVEQRLLKLENVVGLLEKKLEAMDNRG